MGLKNRLKCKNDSILPLSPKILRGKGKTIRKTGKKLELNFKYKYKVTLLKILSLSNLSK